jgi:hypothetical protein
MPNARASPARVSVRIRPLNSSEATADVKAIVAPVDDRVRCFSSCKPGTHHEFTVSGVDMLCGTHCQVLVFDPKPDHLHGLDASTLSRSHRQPTHSRRRSK